MGIPEIRGTTESCKHCFMCRHACPTFLATKLDSHTPRGYALLLSEIDHGFQSWTDSIVERFYQCSQCGLCREDCAYHWAEDEVVRNAREEIVAQERTPEKVRSIASSLINGRAPSGRVQVSWSPVSCSPDRKNADVLYLPGCATRDSHPEILQAMDSLLGALHADWTVLGEEPCCGVPLWDLGYSAEAKAAAKKLAQNVHDLMPRILLTGCPHCYRSFKELYPAWGVSLPEGLSVMHASQYLEAQIAQGLLKPRRVEGFSRASYHDPCQLGRKMGVFDAPRRLIETILGSPPLELFHSGRMAECCGAGSTMFMTDPSLTRRVAEKRIERMREIKSTVVITACQNCKTAFQAASSGEGSDVKALDIVELLAMAL